MRFVMHTHEKLRTRNAAEPLYEEKCLIIGKLAACGDEFFGYIFLQFKISHISVCRVVMIISVGCCFRFR